MASRRDKDFKDYQISERKKIGSGLTNAPVWLMQKAGKRLWNARQKRTWKNIDLRGRFEAHKTKQAKRVIKKCNHTFKKTEGKKKK